MTATIFIEAGRQATTNPAIWPVIAAGVFLTGATAITIGAAFVADWRIKPAPSRDGKLPTDAASSDPVHSAASVLASYGAQVRRMSAEERCQAVRNALRQALDGLSEDERAQARIRGMER